MAKKRIKRDRHVTVNLTRQEDEYLDMMVKHTGKRKPALLRDMIKLCPCAKCNEAYHYMPHSDIHCEQSPHPCMSCQHRRAPNNVLPV